MTCSRSGTAAREIVQGDLAQRATVERIDGSGLCEHTIEAFAGLRKLPVVEIQVAQLFIIADRRIVEDRALPIP